MLKMTIDNEEVVSNNNFTIKEEMLSPSSTILNNTYPKSWENDKDYTSRFYYPKDYSKLNIQNFSIEPEEAGATVLVNGSATLTDVDSSKESRVTKLLGQTSQTGTPTPSSPIPVNVVSGDNEISITGKNLLNRASASENKIFAWVDGIENTVNSCLGSDYIKVNIDDKYIQNYSSQVMFYNKNKEYLGCLQTGGTTIAKATGNYFTSFTVPNVNDIYYMRLGYRAGYGGNPADMLDKSIMLNKGTTLFPYEPYIGQDYPISLGGQNIYDSSYRFGGIIYGRGTVTESNGLFSATATQADTFIWNVCGVGTTYTGNIGYLIEVNEGETYYFKATNSNFDKNFITTYNSSKVSLGFAQQGNSFSYTVASGVKYISFRFGISNATVGTTYTTEIIVTKDNRTPIELCKIGDYQDYIYKDNGSWYLHKEIGKAVLDGSESWNLYSAGGSQPRRFGLYQSKWYKDSIPILSNYFIGDLVASQVDLSIWTQTNYLAITDKNNFYADANALKTWLGTHNTSVYYVLATPTTTEITDEDLIAQLDDLESS